MKPFLAGKKSAGCAALQTGRSAPLRSCTGPIHRAEAEVPTVEVIKEGDKVVRLIVICVCGERTEIDCLYPAGS